PSPSAKKRYARARPTLQRPWRRMSIRPRISWADLRACLSRSLPRAGSLRGVNVSPEQFPGPLLDAAASSKNEQTAVLAGGCFWCVEAVYRQLDGVTSVTNGYAGGTSNSASYETVSGGRTDQAEAYHQDYAARNPTNPYILFTARPKVEKVRKYYTDRIKSAR